MQSSSKYMRVNRSEYNSTSSFAKNRRPVCPSISKHRRPKRFRALRFSFSDKPLPTRCEKLSRGAWRVPRRRSFFYIRKRFACHNDDSSPSEPCWSRTSRNAKRKAKNSRSKCEHCPRSQAIDTPDVLRKRGLENYRKTVLAQFEDDPFFSLQYEQNSIVLGRKISQSIT